jgi:hypothetical protein
MPFSIILYHGSLGSFRGNGGILEDVPQWDEHLQICALSRITQWTIVYFIPYTFHLLQCCNASVQSVDPLPEHRFQSVNADFVQIFQTPERSSSADPNCCPWMQFLRCPNKKQETRNKKKSEGAKCGEEGGCGGFGAIRKKLSSQKALVIFAGCDLALSTSTTSLLSPLSPRHAEQRSR